MRTTAHSQQQEQHMQDDTIRTDWRAIPALVEILNEGAKNPTFTDHAVRHYVRHADENGLAPHVRRLGRKILISQSGFMHWLNAVPRTYEPHSPPIHQPKPSQNRRPATRRRNQQAQAKEARNA
jgi:hypothetical protein